MRKKVTQPSIICLCHTHKCQICNDCLCEHSWRRQWPRGTSECDTCISHGLL